MGCQEWNLGWPHTRLVPYWLCYHFSPSNPFSSPFTNSPLYSRRDQNLTILSGYSKLGAWGLPLVVTRDHIEPGMKTGSRPLSHLDNLSFPFLGLFLSHTWLCSGFTSGGLRGTIQGAGDWNRVQGKFPTHCTTSGPFLSYFEWKWQCLITSWMFPCESLEIVTLAGAAPQWEAPALSKLTYTANKQVLMLVKPWLLWALLWGPYIIID